MSDVQRPLSLTLLAILAIVTGIFAGIRGGLLILNGINQLVAGVGGVFDIIMGVLSLGVGVLALVSGIMALKGKVRSIPMMKKYAAALIGFTIVRIIYMRVVGWKVSWLNILLELGIGIATFVIIVTNDDVKNYIEEKQ
jgi:hypothetical protein